VKSCTNTRAIKGTLHLYSPIQCPSEHNLVSVQSVQHQSQHSELQTISSDTHEIAVNVQVTKELKLSCYMPWRHLGAQEV
jgi:hypothetical protein